MIVANSLFPAPAPHPERAAVLGEVHARPFHPVTTPARLLHFAFMTDAQEAAAARAALAEFCTEHGLHGPEAGTKHFRVTLGGQSLRFEQHSEFTTYTLEQAGDAAAPFTPAASGVPSVFARLPQPGRHLVSVDLHIMKPNGEPALDERLFDPASLAASSVIGGRALVACDFLPVNGFVRILVLDLGLDPASAGALAVRLLEIETYRVLALLGLPAAQRLAPVVGEAEAALASISSAMASGGGLDQDNALLERLTALAAKAEAEATRAAFRFGASRAYDSIVTQRLAAIGEQPTGMRQTLSAFLSRRLQPAMRTCQMLQERQADLSVKLARAANLLRTRVDVEIERQNRDLLRSMNDRARMQLRLQQTVEGLSVAAISYYVVSLASYVFKALHETGWMKMEAGVATALAVPVALVGIALIVRRIRRAHSD
ncbi:MAG: hypothetical protein JWN07_2663 [Hyphomicrobiales bacterium]|nr:hypothetical protein [Hyphomicrobiales bacterium]